MIPQIRSKEVELDDGLARNGKLLKKERFVDQGVVHTAPFHHRAIDLVVGSRSWGYHDTQIRCSQPCKMTEHELLSIFSFC